jgi:protein ImuB
LYRHRRLVRLSATERIESGWWDRRGIGRDYFIARTAEGSRVWIYRERAGRRRWYLHGYFG